MQYNLGDIMNFTLRNNSIMTILFIVIMSIQSIWQVLISRYRPGCQCLSVPDLVSTLEECAIGRGATGRTGIFRCWCGVSREQVCAATEVLTGASGGTLGKRWLIRN